MPNRLMDLTINEGSLVDSPANKGATVVLFKRETQPEPSSVKEAGVGTTNKSAFRLLLTALGKKLNLTPQDVADVKKQMGDMGEAEPAETFDEVMAEQSMQEAVSECMNLYRALSESLCSILNDPTTDKPSLIAQSLTQFVAAVQEELQEALSGNEDDEGVAKAGAKISTKRLNSLKDMHGVLAQLIREQDPQYQQGQQAGGKKMADDVITTQKSADEVLKSLPPELREKIEKADKLEAQMVELQKSADTAVAVAKAEKEAREVEKSTVRAEKDWSHLVGQADIKGAIHRKLVKMADKEVVTKGDFALTTEEAGELLTMLKAANEQVVKGKLYSELGSTGGTDGNGDGSAVSEVEKRTSELVQKNAQLSKNDATARVFREDPALYNRYRKETRASAGSDD